MNKVIWVWKDMRMSNFSLGMCGTKCEACKSTVHYSRKRMSPILIDLVVLGNPGPPMKNIP